MLLSSVAPLLLLLSVSSVVVETAVAVCSSGRDRDHRPLKNCSGAGFDRPPPGLEPSTQVLLFPLNQFSEFSCSSFTVFKDIYEIDLSQNQVSSLAPSEPSVLPSLSVLWLGSNLLRAVPDHGFSGSPALTKLFLNNNRLSSVTDLSFSGLGRLEILDLSNNLLQTLPAQMMFPLRSIETLYLEANKIAVMPDGWFRQKEEVPYLYLSANPWACSCSLGYLRSYLEDYDYNVYVRDGPIISSDVQSVICDSPESLKGRSVIKLEESDFCDGPTTYPPVYIPTATTTTTTTTAWTTVGEYMTSSFDRAVTRYEKVHFREWFDSRGDGRVVKNTDPPTGLPTTVALTTPPTTTTTVGEYVTSSFYKVVTWYETFHFTYWTDRPETSPPPTTEPPTAALTTTPTQTVTATTADASSAVPPTSTKPQTFPSKHTTKVDVITRSTSKSAKTTATATVSTVSDIRVSGKSASMAREVFCFWMFFGCVFLCVVSGISLLITALRLYFWYRGVYKTLKCIAAGKEQVRMVTFGQAQARYRTVLFVNKDAKKEECYVNLGPKDRILECTNAEKVVYTQTMCRDFSKEEEIDAKEVLAGCRASPEANVAARKKRYSVILREVREEDGGETERCDWVVGGWEAEQGAGLRGSWGAWLGQFIPNMPWGVSAPPRSEAEFKERRLKEDEKEG